jgi:cytochrome P450
MIESLMVQLAIAVLLWLFCYLILYQQFIRPLLAINFYRKQGIQCEFVPLTGSSPIDSQNVQTNGDFYHGWLAKCLGKVPRPRLFCKNIGSTCALVVADPLLVKEMFINKDDFIKHPFQNALVKRLSPFGLVLLEGPLWKKHRKFISKGFEYERIDTLLG